MPRVALSGLRHCRDPGYRPSKNSDSHWSIRSVVTWPRSQRALSLTISISSNMRINATSSSSIQCLMITQSHRATHWWLYQWRCCAESGGWSRPGNSSPTYVIFRFHDRQARMRKDAARFNEVGLLLMVVYLSCRIDYCRATTLTLPNQYAQFR